MITIISVQAAQWVELGADMGMKTGMYMDIDAISDSGNQISLVYKYTNVKLLQALSMLDDKQCPLSVCLMQADAECSTGKPLSFAMLCYGKDGSIVIDEVGREEEFNKYDQYTNNKRNINCNAFREMKKSLTK